MANVPSSGAWGKKAKCSTQIDLPKTHYMMMHYGAAPVLFERARRLRKNETLAEKALWKCLSNNQLGVKFRRQHPLHLFIADFYCHELKLVIEVDGGIHLLKENQEYDRMRTDLINEFDISVIRFTNNEIFFQIEQVISRIQSLIPERN